MSGRDRRLLIQILIISVVSVLASWFAIHQGQQHLLKNEARNTAIHWAEFLQQNLSEFDDILTNGLISSKDQRVFDFASSAGRVFHYEVIRSDGITAHSSWSGDFGKANDAEVLSAVLKAGKHVVKLTRRESTETTTMVISEAYVPIIIRDRIMGAIKVYIDITTRAVALEQARNYALLGLILLLSIIGALCGSFVWRNLRDRNRELNEIIESRERVLTAEQALRESDERHRTMLERTLVAMIVHNGREILYANQAAVKLYRAASVDDLLGRNPIELVHPEDQKSVLARHKTVNKNQNTPTEEQRRVRFDGSVIIVECAGSPITWSGEPCILSEVRDITDRKQAEQAVRESEEQFRAAFSVEGIGMFVTDGSGRMIEVNRTLCEFLGYAEEELLGRNRVDFTHPDDLEATMRRKQHVQSGASRPRDVEKRFIRKDGRTVWAVVNASVIRDHDGKVRMVVGAIHDITERKQAEEALRMSEARLQAFMEYTPSAILIKDIEGRYILANRRWHDWFNPEGGEIFGKTVFDFYPEEHAQEITRTDREILKTGKLLETELETPFADSTRRITLLQKFPIFDQNGVITAIAGVNTDITERKALEEQLRQSQKMEAIGQLTGGIAHDFNNLLTVVHGNLELIAERLEDPAVLHMAQSAINAAWRGAELTQRLLAFSRKQTLAPAVIELDELVSGTTDMLRRTLGETIEIEVAGDDDLWKCKADPSQLENAILNLALNARDAMPDGGRLTIETSNVKLDDADAAARTDVSPGDYVKVSVSDTGTGMSRNAIDHAFEPFFTTKDVGEGSGLGLSMVHGFINQSDGFVTIDSTEGAGTTVNLHLPRSSETSAPARQDLKGKDPLSQGEKVLVVEDDQEVRALTINMLADLGYDTVEAVDGKQAIEVLRTVPGIDLLFTDVVLPGGISGIDVAREAARLNPDIKILFTSGYADDVLARHGEIDANVDLVQKPFRKTELAHKLRTAMGRSLH